MAVIHLAYALDRVYTLLEQDYADVKAEIDGAAKPAFVATLKVAVLKAANTAQPTTPQGGCFNTPYAAPPPQNTASPLVDSVVVSVNVGMKSLVTARLITVATTPTFAELLAIAVADQSDSERAMLATSPVKVAVYSSLQHLSTQKVEAALSNAVSATISLGYRHVVFVHAPPARQPNARPSESAFEHMMHGGELPDLFTCEHGYELAFDKALFNWLVDDCKHDNLGVRRDEIECCTLLLKAVRDGLQAMDGREGNFQSSRVPERFKAYKALIKRAKKPAKAALKSVVIRGYADRLRGAIDRHAFTRSTLWADFVGDCVELHAVLAIKYDQMTGKATAQAQQRADPTVLGRSPCPVWYPSPQVTLLACIPY